MSDTREYKMSGNFKARIATQQEKAIGNPSGHLSANPGEYILEFPFDCGGTYSGIPFSIPIPAHVFTEYFSEVKTPAKKAPTKKKAA